MIAARRDVDLTGLWANLGAVGRDAKKLAGSGRHGVGVVGGYLASVAERDGRQVVVITDDPVTLRGGLPG